VTIHKQTVLIHPIIDNFYSPNPAHTRSAGFAQAKGQTITGLDKQMLKGNLDPGNTDGDGSTMGSPFRSEEVISGAINRLKIG
jgi:glutamine amidotransferase